MITHPKLTTYGITASCWKLVEYKEVEGAAFVTYALYTDEAALKAGHSPIESSHGFKFELAQIDSIDVESCTDTLVKEILDGQSKS